MNDSQLESFVRAADLGSFRKAAKEQFLTVPSFAKRINSLETELGYELFKRSSKGVQLSAEGTQFYHHAVEVLSILSSAKETTCNSSDENNTITVGIWWRTPSFILCAYEEFKRLHPEATIDFVETDGDSFAEDIANKKIDLFYGANSYQIEGHNLRFDECCKRNIYCAFSPQSKLAQYAKLTPALLASYKVYAGADWRSIPDLAPSAIAFFSLDSVIKKSIFGEVLLIECMEDKAVSIFFENVSKSFMPTLEARPMDWPAVSSGICFRDDPSPLLRSFVNICKKHMTDHNAKMSSL